MIILCRVNTAVGSYILYNSVTRAYSLLLLTWQLHANIGIHAHMRIYIWHEDWQSPYYNENNPNDPVRLGLLCIIRWGVQPELRKKTRKHSVIRTVATFPAIMAVLSPKTRYPRTSGAPCGLRQKAKHEY